MKVLLEIRAGEGGADAKLLVPQIADMYVRFAELHGADVTMEYRGSL